MAHWLSQPIESLLQSHSYPLAGTAAEGRAGARTPLSIDTLVVGSGYGAAMASLALLESEDAPALWVFERGAEYLPGDFPRTIAELPGHIGTDQLNPGALWDIRAGDNVVTISGRGLGGTSLVNANVAARISPAVLNRWPAAGPQAAPWAQRFALCYDKLEALLGVTRPSTLRQQQPGFRALQATAARLGSDVEAAPVTINFSGPTTHSVDHAPCDDCGNCVIGCHTGAKGSLNMNAWPLARQLGAELFTGVVVTAVERLADGRWRVHCHCAGRSEQEFEVLAERVILAAGTLGSTEILKRSGQKYDLGLSDRLGAGFSTNGDALVAGVGQRTMASKAAGVPGATSGDKPGPTISGMASVALDESDPEVRFTLEDAVIPYPLTEIWQELLVSQSLLRRFADGSVSAWHQQHKKHDFLARSSALGEHSQALLIMGLDAGDGHFEWENDRLKPVWTSTGRPDYFSRLDERLRRDEREVFDGGLFMPNMLSQPLPPGFDGVLEGADELRGSLLSVHPLGGCCMATDIEEGVVNTRGQVFTRQLDAGFYDNLYVLDGAIIPSAIGTNPFLTIATLSYILARDIALGAAGAPVTEPQSAFPALRAPFRTLPSHPRRALPDPERQAVVADFNERLVLHLDHGKRSFFPWSRANEVALPELRAVLGMENLDDNIKALVLDATFSFGGDNTLERWLEDPQQPLEARATLSADPVGGILTTADRPLRSLTELTGTVILGQPESPGRVASSLRLASAVLKYMRYRGMDVMTRLPAWLMRLVLSEQAVRIRAPELFDRNLPDSRSRKRSLLRDVTAFLRIAKLQSQRRYLVYKFRSDKGVVIEGRKTLGYGLGLPGVLRAWLVLPATIRAATGGRSLDVEFELDTIRVTRGELPLQIVSSPHSPASLAAVGGFAMYALRILMQTHFWSFGAPSYRQFATREQMETTGRQGRYFEPPEFIFYGEGGRHRSTRREKFEYGEKVAGELRPMSRLIRYQPGSGDPARRKSLLLIHGLAHSSRVFWTDTVDCNFVQYFLGLNYDVWVLDHRVSANYVRSLTKEHTWDDIANIDIPWAVETAFRRINQDAASGEERGIHLFAHCIGAGAAAIAVLNGKLNYIRQNVQGETETCSMLASLIPHAVTPWLTASAENRARANVWALVKDLEPLQFIEPMPYRNPPLLETVYDRLAALALNADERRQWKLWRGYRDWRGPGFAQSIYTRYTLFWGRQWHDANINQATRYEFAGMIGPVPIGVMQQVYFSLTRGLLAANDGSNPYVKKANFNAHWTFPTLFLHGNRNTVFDMESSRHSADRLTRLRMLAQSGSYPQGDLKPQDYARHRVWIEVLDDYGHMDIIFSKTAERDVFPRLHEFFCAAEEGRMLHRYDQRFATTASQEWFVAQCASNGSADLIRRPLTGPILSRPTFYPEANSYPETSSYPEASSLQRGVGAEHLATPQISNGEIGLRLWVEAQDFAAISASGLQLQPVAGPGGARTRAAAVPWTTRSRSLPEAQFAQESLRHWQEEFWLYDIRIPASETRALRLSLTYDSDEESGVNSRPWPQGKRLHWHDLPWYQRVLNNVSGPQPLTLLAGSCLYPGFPFERQLSTAIFDGMRSQLPDQPRRRGADAVVLLGDQIYADATAGLLDPLTEYERFRYPYRQAFGSPAARRLMSHIPVYLAVDDHEYRNDWRGSKAPNECPGRSERLAREDREFQYSRNMAWLFQMHHDNAWDDEQVRLWYDCRCAGYPLFVFDTRFQRRLSASDQTRLLDVEQFEAFERWLEQQASDAAPVVFLASGSALAPVSRDLIAAPALAAHDDTLFAYPRFLAHLTRHVAQLKAGHGWTPRIVWLTGDPHLSCMAELTFRVDDAQLAVTQICCSGLFAPLPFINANAAEHDWGKPFSLTLIHDGEPLEVEGEQTLLTDHQQHFVRIDLVPERNFELQVQAFDAMGQAVGPAVVSSVEAVFHGAPEPLPQGEIT